MTQQQHQQEEDVASSQPQFRPLSARKRPALMRLDTVLGSGVIPVKKKTSPSVVSSSSSPGFGGVGGASANKGGTGGGFGGRGGVLAGSNLLPTLVCSGGATNGNIVEQFQSLSLDG